MRFMVILYILGLHILLGIKNKQIGYQNINFKSKFYKESIVPFSGKYLQLKKKKEQ